MIIFFKTCFAIAFCMQPRLAFLKLFGLPRSLSFARNDNLSNLSNLSVVSLRGDLEGSTWQSIKRALLTLLSAQFSRLRIQRVLSHVILGVVIFTLTVAAVVAITALMSPAWAQQVTIGLGEDTNVTERAIQLIALITVLSLAPSILIMMTSFVRIVVVLSLLRTAIGIQQSPPNAVITSLALFLTAFIMMPVFQTAYNTAIQPLIAEQIELPEAFDRASQPFRTFMLRHVREKDLALFVELAGGERPATPEDVSLQVLIPAFMISELKRAFEIGFLLFVPFVVIDLVVASVLMSMGMMMLPPILISLPFKLIFFVLVDGWHMVAGSLVKSFGV